METLNQYIDHTLLTYNADSNAIDCLLKEAISYEFKAICVAPNYVSYCNKSLNDIEGFKPKIASVVGFPNGNDPLISKLSTVEFIAKEGCNEVDFVINSSYIKNQKWDEIFLETKILTSVIHDSGLTSKWIIESSANTEFENLKIIDIANHIKPHFVKTSTGIHSKARIEDVVLIRKHLDENIKIKASGGIKTREEAIQFIKNGASRIGTSSGVFMMG